MGNYVEVTKRGFGRRGKDSIGGALFGLVLVLVGAVLLFWNEGRAVKRYKDLKEGAGAVVAIDSAQVDPAAEGKLVHLVGETRTAAPLRDADFGISAPAVKLVRRAEMYQWVEVERSETRKSGSGTETVKTYSYEKQWRDSPVDSTRFKVAAEHRNPGEMRYRSATLTAEKVALGAFTLPPFLVAKMGNARPLPVESLEDASEEVRSAARLTADGLYFGNDPDAPAVGDLRVGFAAVPNGTVSVVAQQSASSFAPYRTKTGGTVELLESGSVAAADMFQMAQDRNKALTWGLRVGGFLLLGIAFSMVLGPIAVLASVLPFLGRLASAGTSIVAFLLAAILWCLTVSIAWILHRPVLGAAILAAAVVLFVLVAKRLRRSAPEPSPQTAGPPPLA